MKTCSKCHIDKPEEEFNKDKKSKDGLGWWCRSCQATSNKKRYDADRVRLVEISRKYNINNKSRVKKYKRKYNRIRHQTDIHYRLANNLRSRLYQALKNNQKSGSAVKDLGCNIVFFKWHLESQFESGMTWDNYGQWHIDHIQSISSFDLTDRKQLLKVCHYTNLQPLWQVDNLRKGAK